MAHFAQLENSEVVRVVAVRNEIVGLAFPDSESVGQTHLAGMGLGDTWLQTSYNNNFRKQYAGIGYSYNADADVFIAPQPYPSWSLDINHDWQPPTPKPADHNLYMWDEPTLSWIQAP